MSSNGDDGIEDNIREFAPDEALYRTIIDSMRHGVSIIKLLYDSEDVPNDFLFLTVNPAYEEQSGLKEEQVIGKTAKQILSFVEPIWSKRYGEVVRTQTSKSFEEYNASLDKWFRVDASPLPEKDCLVAVFEDITSRKKAEQGLRENAELYRTLFENTEDGFVLVEPIFDKDGNSDDYWMLKVNETWERQTGLRAADLVGKRIRESLPEVESVWPSTFAEVAKMGRPKHFESFNHNSGKWYELDAFPYGKGKVGVLFRDITERKRGEEALEDERSRLELVLDNIPVAVGFTDARGGLLLENKMLASIWSGNNEISTVSDYGKYKAFWPETGKPVKPEEWPAARALRGEESTETFDIERFDGTKGTIVVSSKPIRDDKGNITGTVWMNQDVTERRNAEEALKESEERLSLAQQVAHIGTFEWNIQTGKNVWTPELETMYGLPLGGFPGTQPAWEALVHPDDRKEAVRRVGEAIEKGSFEGEWRVVWPDGSVHWLQGRGWVFKNEEGEPLILLGVNIDITERKQMEVFLKKSAEAARRQAEEVETIMDVVPAAIWVAYDPECRIITGNQAADSFYESKEGENVSAGPASGSEWDQTRRFFKEGRELRPEELPMQESAAKGIEVKDSELEVLLPSGRKIVMLGNARPLFNDKGETRGSVASFLDITERKRMEEALKASTDELRRSNAELQQFAYVASHDLQEPLRMVTSYIGLLNKKFGDELNPQAKEYMSYAVDGSTRMKALIGDLLTYSRIDSQSIVLDKINMNEVARMVEEDLHIAIKDSGAEVIINPLPTICADRTQMKQLLTNLISNAIKFRRDGVTPRVEVSAVTCGNDFVFTISDNGIGVDPKHADKLFKMFSRLHTKEEYPGTGIGLAISKKIVERHHGRIWFESEPGKGTTFYITIPA